MFLILRNTAFKFHRRLFSFFRFSIISTNILTKPLANNWSLLNFERFSFVNRDLCPEGTQFDRNQRFRVSAAQMY